MSRTREATLVIVASDGTVRGAIGPLEVPQPWWQETGPVVDLLPGSVVLRLLEATPDPVEHLGGSITYLVEHDGAIPPPLELRPWTGRLSSHSLRQPWAEVGGPAADLDWVASVVDIDPGRRPRQHRTWNLSAVWSIPILGREPNGAGEVWLKCVPSFFAHEAGVLTVMADQQVPDLVAHDQHRLLLAPMPGEDGFVISQDEELAMIDALVDIQLASADRVGRLMAVGVPDSRTPCLVAELSELVARLAPDDPLLGPFIESLPDRLAEVDEHRLPTVLVHGDPHGGNCRRGVDPPLWFDWGDAYIGNPLMDVAALHRMSEPTVEHWLNRWADAAPQADVATVWHLLEPVALLRMARVYQVFLDNIEPAERLYHRYDVGHNLELARSWLVENDE